ncbi:hypothetical protein [Cryptosporangium arvum]|uniref:hypothetical protein n=1 Tax=Cryptosporangium arvum TaxID=80871 RepID=UPI00056099E3|nr:hypothetical protein [Cryptosporangium arvum]
MTETPNEPAVHERSGADVAEAVGAAEHDSALHETHTHPERTKSGESHVERSQGDPAMTEPPSGAETELGSSAAAAQSVRGARASDRIAAD